MFSTPIKDVMFDNLNFLYSSSNSLPENVKLDDKKNMRIKYSAFHNYLKDELDLKLTSLRMIERKYVMQPPSMTEKIIGLIAVTAGLFVPILGLAVQEGNHIKHLVIDGFHLFK